MADELNEKLGTTAVVWNLSDLYTSLQDPTIQEEITFCEEEAALLRDTFAGKLDTLDPGQLARLVRRFERIEAFIGKVATFAFLNFTTQIKNQEAGAFLQQVKETSSRIARDTVFFELEWSKMDEKMADPLLSAEETAHYRHYLQNIRRYAKHMLSQAEETLLIEISPVGRGSWTNLFEKVLGNLQFGAKRPTVAPK